MSTRTVTTTRWYFLGSVVDSLLDTMVNAQRSLGTPVTWTKVTPTWAVGEYNDGDERSRIAVIDVDNTDGHDVAQLTVWAASALDEVILPD